MSKNKIVMNYTYCFDCEISNESRCKEFGYIEPGIPYCFLYGKYLKLADFKINLGGK